MSTDDASGRTDAPELIQLDAGHVLAFADDHRRGLHRRGPVKACSRCLLAALDIPEVDSDEPREAAH